MKSILFDLDDTILDFCSAEKEALSKTLLHLGIQPEKRIIKRYSEINLAQWKLLELGKLTQEEVNVRRYRLLFDEIGAVCCPNYATGYYEKLLARGHYFVDGAQLLLKTLSCDYPLYLVSNGSSDVQKSRIKSADISKYLSGIFISEEIGFEKPDIRFFDYCFSKIPNFIKGETLIVGDSLSSDIKGGKNAGITTVWFNPSDLSNLTDIIPDYEIKKLLDLLSLLKTI
ncbi:MAG TPA: YjjG family noncanonical pyrimidine nucleotidase [Clostridiales bacterium]|nr:YjjG family noncanonical pyrimidine nucleotidase [Clostridiales bacterium]